MGLFITFEGGEGSGKSTQAGALCRRLSSRGFPVLLAKEPGNTSLGRALGRLLKREGMKIDALAELFLFAAARAELVKEIIRPALERGMIVLCDRYAQSSLAYQGYGRGLDLKLVERVNEIATGSLHPDLIILLDLEVGQGLHRQNRRDRFEREELSFHEKVRQGYLELASSGGNRWQVIDASLPRKKVEEALWKKVQKSLTLKFSNSYNSPNRVRRR